MTFVINLHTRCVAIFIITGRNSNFFILGIKVCTNFALFVNSCNFNFTTNCINTHTGSNYCFRICWVRSINIRTTDDNRFSFITNFNVFMGICITVNLSFNIANSVFNSRSSVLCNVVDSICQVGSFVSICNISTIRCCELLVEVQITVSFCSRCSNVLNCSCNISWIRLIACCRINCLRIISSNRTQSANQGVQVCDTLSICINSRSNVVDCFINCCCTI